MERRNFLIKSGTGIATAFIMSACSSNDTDVNVTDVNVTDVNATDVNVTDVNITDVNITDVNVTDVNITDVNVTDVTDDNVSGTDISITDVADTNISTTDVTDESNSDIFSYEYQDIADLTGYTNISPVAPSSYKTENSIRINARKLDFSNFSLLEQVTDSYFSSLEIEDRYLIANKVMSTLFKGINLIEYKELVESGTFISWIQSELANPLSNDQKEQIVSKIDTYYYDYYLGNKTKEEILVRLYETPISRDYMLLYSWFTIEESIIASSALQVGSINAEDMRAAYYWGENLFLNENPTMKSFVDQYVRSKGFSDRFPGGSGENAARESMEIFRSDKDDSKVPLVASTVWQYYRFDTDSNQLINDSALRPSETIELWGKDISDIETYTEALVYDDQFIVTQIRHLVSKFFPNFSYTEKEEITLSILNDRPDSYQDIIFSILFSKKYLENHINVKNAIKSALPFYKSLEVIDLRTDIFRRFRYELLTVSSQEILTYKLGPSNKEPDSAFSIALTANFLEKYTQERFRYNYGSWLAKELDDLYYSFEDIVEMFFLSFLGYKPNESEILTLQIIFIDEGFNLDLPTISEVSKLISILITYINHSPDFYVS